MARSNGDVLVSCIASVCMHLLMVEAEEVRQRDVINYSLAHVRERNANLESRSRAQVVGQSTKRRC